MHVRWDWSGLARASGDSTGIKRTTRWALYGLLNKHLETGQYAADTIDAEEVTADTLGHWKEHCRYIWALETAMEIKLDPCCQASWSLGANCGKA